MPDRGTALARASQVLGAAVVGLQAAEAHVRIAADVARERRGAAGRQPQRPWPTSTSTKTSIDAPLRASARPSRSTPSGESTATARRVPRASVRQPLELRGIHDLVADVELRHARGGQRLGLRDLLHAHAHGAGLDLQLRDRALLCVLACGRSASPRSRAKAASAAMLRSSASTSTTSAGVSIASTGSPTRAGAAHGSDLVERRALEVVRVAPADQREALRRVQQRLMPALPSCQRARRVEWRRVAAR